MSTQEIIEIDPHALDQDPWPIYAQLRREAPVMYFPLSGEWLVTRWAECDFIGSHEELYEPSDDYAPRERVFGSPNVLTMSGPDHKGLRQGIDPHLRPRSVNRYIEDLCRPIARQYVEAVREHGAADLTTEVYEPISVRVIADVLGMGDVESDTLVRWFQTLSDGLQNVTDDQAVWTAAEQANAEIDAYMREAIDRLSAHPDDSGLSHMIHDGMPDGQMRTFEELMPTIRVIILGGLQEPGHAAANSTYGVLLDPEQRRQMFADPEQLAPLAVNEGLRWIAPIGVTVRRTTQATELAGVALPKGAVMGVVLGSANRDEARYESPERFDLNRGRQTHAAFGYGSHFCSGHFISRHIERIALEEVFRTLAGLRLDPDQPVIERGWRFRGVKHLPVLWDA
ncbi:MAG: cytochrome P450-pinF2, plant-inducible [Solirubrobacterales bacterium]|jgi:cytochrome P450|nr:cytochrome P450-pinF2, plant-inducible [Solirubrobacterales bacterium]